VLKVPPRSIIVVWPLITPVLFQLPANCNVPPVTLIVPELVKVLAVRLPPPLTLMALPLVKLVRERLAPFRPVQDNF
jgi:hypothetical protein